MRTSVAAIPRETEGNEVDQGLHTTPLLETPGNSVSRRCLLDAIDASAVPHKVLAPEVGMTEQQFSKSLSGIKGGNFNHVLDHIRPAIRLDYARRLVDIEREGGLEELAAQELAHAAIRYLSTRRIQLRMAKV